MEVSGNFIPDLFTPWEKKTPALTTKVAWWALKQVGTFWRGENPLSPVRKSQRKNVVTYLLTYSMVESPSWPADWLAASQEIPRISRNPKVHYRTHKRPPPVPILGQPVEGNTV